MIRYYSQLECSVYYRNTSHLIPFQQALRKWCIHLQNQQNIMRINAIAKDINRKQTEGHLVNKRA